MSPIYSNFECVCGAWFSTSSDILFTSICFALFCLLYLVFFFFFQAEDGIRDHCVTGVQTCALPISLAHRRPARRRQHARHETHHPASPHPQTRHPPPNLTLFLEQPFLPARGG